MFPEPFWVAHVKALLVPAVLDAVELGPLWHLAERIQFVRENVESALLEDDLRRWPELRPLWNAFLHRESGVLQVLSERRDGVAHQLREGKLPPAAFRAVWEKLGFVAHAEGAGTPADDYLDGVFHVARLTTGEDTPAFGTLNMASRAQRVADFFSVTELREQDVVLDLGSGNGKLVLAVAASSSAKVIGVECGNGYVESARTTAALLGLESATFIHADVRDVDLAQGSVFYLYYPFCGPVAQTIAERLGLLAMRRTITVYASGPRNGFGEYFGNVVESGRLRLMERRGEFSEVMVLRSV